MKFLDDQYVCCTRGFHVLYNVHVYVCNVRHRTPFVKKTPSEIHSQTITVTDRQKTLAPFALSGKAQVYSMLLHFMCLHYVSVRMQCSCIYSVHVYALFVYAVFVYPIVHVHVATCMPFPGHPSVADEAWHWHVGDFCFHVHVHVPLGLCAYMYMYNVHVHAVVCS